MMKFKILDKKEALEINYQRALNKKNGEKFISAFSLYENEKYPRWEYDLQSLEIIQKKKLNPISKSLTEIDKEYNEMTVVLPIWIQKAFISDYYFRELNEEFDLYDLWNMVESNIRRDQIAIMDIPIDQFIEGENQEFSKFSIVAVETTKLNELPNHIFREIREDKKAIYKYAIKNHLNEYIVDSGENLIFRFNIISFDENQRDLLITGKKIKKVVSPNIHLQYDVSNPYNLIEEEGRYKGKYLDSTYFKVRIIQSRYEAKTEQWRHPKMLYYDEIDEPRFNYVEFLNDSKMYDSFEPHFNLLHSDLHNYSKDQRITTNGVFIHKPKFYGNERNIHNVGICLVFNKFGYVLRLEGEYDAIKKYKADIARDFRYHSDLPPSEEAAKYSINGKKVKWAFYDPNIHSNQMFDEPREYTEYEGEFHEYALKLNIHVSYYNQDRRRHIRKKVAENLIFDLYEV